MLWLILAPGAPWRLGRRDIVSTIREEAPILPLVLRRGVGEGKRKKRIMKIKVFTVKHSNEMERCVNQWFEENPGAEIQHVRQSESMNNDSWSMTLSIVYLERVDTRIGFEKAS